MYENDMGQNAGKALFVDSTKYPATLPSLIILITNIALYILYFTDVINTPLLAIIMITFVFLISTIMSILTSILLNLKSIIRDIIFKPIIITAMYFYYIDNIDYAFKMLILFYAVEVLVYTIDKATHNLYANAVTKKLNKMNLSPEEYTASINKIQKQKVKYNIFYALIFLTINLIFYFTLREYIKYLLFFYAIMQIIFNSILMVLVSIVGILRHKFTRLTR